MSTPIETAPTPSGIVRSLCRALSAGDVTGVPAQLPYGGTHQGRAVLVQSILGAMVGYAAVTITGAEVFEGPTGIVGKLSGTLTAHTTDEQFPLTMIELHRVENGLVQRIDVYTKNPHELAAFYAPAGAGAL